MWNFIFQDNNMAGCAPSYCITIRTKSNSFLTTRRALLLWVEIWLVGLVALDDDGVAIVDCCLHVRPPKHLDMPSGEEGISGWLGDLCWCVFGLDRLVGGLGGGGVEEGADARDLLLVLFGIPPVLRVLAVVVARILAQYAAEVGGLDLEAVGQVAGGKHLGCLGRGCGCLVIGHVISPCVANLQGVMSVLHDLNIILLA
jgi:hypothetical protein